MNSVQETGVIRPPLLRSHAYRCTLPAGLAMISSHRSSGRPASPGRRHSCHPHPHTAAASAPCHRLSTSGGAAAANSSASNALAGQADPPAGTSADTPPAWTRTSRTAAGLAIRHSVPAGSGHDVIRPSKPPPA